MTNCDVLKFTSNIFSFSLEKSTYISSEDFSNICNSRISTVDASLIVDIYSFAELRCVDRLPLERLNFFTNLVLTFSSQLQTFLNLIRNALKQNKSQD